MRDPLSNIDVPIHPPTHRLRFREAFALIAACLYAPFSWLLLIDYDWDAYRWGWIKVWPILPGFLPGAIWLHPNGTLELIAWTVTTFTLLFGLSWLASRGTIALTIAVVLALAVSVPSAYIAYALFRA